MSDYYHAIVDVDATPDEAESLAQEVVRSLVAEGVVQSTLDPEAAFGGPGGYRPGNRIKELYDVLRQTLPFWNLVTNGLQVCTKRWVNDWGFTCLEELVCPRCSVSYSLDDSVGQQFGEAVGQFYDGHDHPLVHCPACSQDTPAPIWHTRPHLGFAHLAFVFWNWPTFDSSSWKLDIPRLVAETLHHKIVLTYGRM